MNSLELRIAQLEKQSRLYRMGFLVLLLVIGAFLFMSFNNKQAVPDLLQAKKIQVVDNRGNVVVELMGSDITGNGEVNTYTPNKKRLISLFTSDGGAGAINTFDQYQSPVFKITQTTGGGGYMALLNSDTKEIVEFGATDSDGGYMRINDRFANKLAWITYTQGGGGYFSLFNGSRESFRVSTPNTGARIGIYNGNDKRIVFMGSQDNQDGNITIYNGAGTRTGGVPN